MTAAAVWVLFQCPGIITAHCELSQIIRKAMDNIASQMSLTSPEERPRTQLLPIGGDLCRLPFDGGIPLGYKNAYRVDQSDIFHASGARQGDPPFNLA